MPMVIDFSSYMELSLDTLHVFGQTHRSAPTGIAEYKFVCRK
jgi:hypothetical protein